MKFLNQDKYRKKVEDRFQNILKASDYFSAWANSKFLALYSNKQNQRWMTEGASEGANWRALNSSYAARKKIIYKDSPGSGTKMLIGTARLIGSLTPPNYRLFEKSGETERFRKLVEKNKITISIAVDSETEYFKYVDEKRPYTKFSDKTKQEIIKSYKKYLSDSFKVVKK